MIRNIQLALVVYLIITGSVVALPNGEEKNPNCPLKNGENVSIVKSEWGHCISVRFDADTDEISITADTMSEHYVEKASVLVNVDDRRIAEFDFDLSDGERWNQTVNISSSLNVVEDEHTVIVSTFGNHTQFNFTREINSSETVIPKPYITNVTIANGTIDGKLSAVVHVTIINPSTQLYGSKLMVHTQETDGSLYVPAVQPGQSKTVKVELHDERGERIVGEARLYTKNLTEQDGALDQVGFVGRAGETTKTWNETYEPVRPTWMENHYKYENDSYSPGVDEQLSGGHEVEGVPVVYPIVALVLSLLVISRLR